jgi:hypothetical protein
MFPSRERRSISRERLQHKKLQQHAASLITQTGM